MSAAKQPGMIVRIVRIFKRWRSSITGRFVKKSEAIADPDHTEEVTLTITEEA